MDRPEIDGLRHVKLPVSDLPQSLGWYERVFGVVTEMEFADEQEVVRGVVLSVPGVPDTELALREDSGAAKRYADFDPIGWSVTDLPAIHGWVDFLDSLGIEHSAVIVASEGWLLTFHDPDGIGHHLYTRARHGIDVSARPGVGRRVEHPAG